MARQTPSHRHDQTMRALIVHNEYGGPSGEEHALREISELLQKNGHQVSWLHRSSAEIRSFRDKAQAFFSGIYSRSSARQMEAAISMSQPDLVLAQNLYPFLSPSVLEVSRNRAVPVVMRCPNYRLFCPNGLHLSHGEICERCLGGKEYWCVLRNCEANYFKSLGYALRNAAARIRRSILDNVAVFVVLSEFAKQRFIAGGIEPERIEVLPNPIPHAPSTPALDDQNGRYITFVGRASPEKGIDDFVAAARALPHLPFAVAGSTERVPELLSRSPRNLTWFGFLKEKDLTSLYAQSQMLVFPFRWFEGFPNVTTRAMAMQKPIIAARIGALPEIVEDGVSGLLFEPGNIDHLVYQIERLSSNPRLCREMGHAGQQKARAQYSPEIVYTKLAVICQRVLGHAV